MFYTKLLSHSFMLLLDLLLYVMPYTQCKTYSEILMQALCSVWRSVSLEAYSWSSHSQWQRRLPVDLPWHYVWWTETWDMSSCVGSHLCSSTVSQSSTFWWHVTWNFYNRQVSQLKLSVCEISLSEKGLCDFSLPLWSSWELCARNDWMQRFVPFWVIMPWVVVIYFWRFVRNYWSHPQGSWIQNFFVFLNPENGTDRLSQNVGKKLPLLTALQPRRAKQGLLTFVLQPTCGCHQ